MFLKVYPQLHERLPLVSSFSLTPEDNVNYQCAMYHLFREAIDDVLGVKESHDDIVIHESRSNEEHSHEVQLVKEMREDLPEKTLLDIAHQLLQDLQQRHQQLLLRAQEIMCDISRRKCHPRLEQPSQLVQDVHEMASELAKAKEDLIQRQNIEDQAAYQRHETNSSKSRKEIDMIVVSLSALQSDTEALQQFSNRLETYATNIVGIAVRLGFRPRSAVQDSNVNTILRHISLMQPDHERRLLAIDAVEKPKLPSKKSLPPVASGMHNVHPAALIDRRKKLKSVGLYELHHELDL